MNAAKMAEMQVLDILYINRQFNGRLYECFHGYFLKEKYPLEYREAMAQRLVIARDVFLQNPIILGILEKSNCQYFK